MSIKEGPLASEFRLSPFHPSDQHVNIALLIARFSLGIPFVYHGSGILLGILGGPGLFGFAGHMHFPIFVAALVGLAEFAGGIAVLTGLLARVGAICIAIVMAGAVLIVHLPHGYDVSNGGMEYALAMLLLSIALSVSGAGHYTLAHYIPKRDDL